MPKLKSGRRSKGRPQLRYKDVCNRDMKALDINTDSWEGLAADHIMWRCTQNQHLKSGERSWWMQKQEEGPTERNATTLTDQRPHTNATFAADIVSPTSVSKATSDAATIEQTGQPGCTPMITLDRRMPYTMARSLTKLARTWSHSRHCACCRLLHLIYVQGNSKDVRPFSL